MKRHKIYILSSFLLFVHAAYSQEIKIIKYRDLKRMETKQNDTTYIFNFWATWCAPCVKELPYFDAISKNYETDKVKVFLISLDFIRQINLRLVPFVKENKLASEVFLLDEPDYNSWISKVDSSWSGAIPATLIINNKNGIRKFFENEFTEENLNKTVQTYIY